MEQRSLFVQASVFGFSFDDRLSHVSASNSGLGQSAYIIPIRS